MTQQTGTRCPTTGLSRLFSVRLKLATASSCLELFLWTWSLLSLVRDLVLALVKTPKEKNRQLMRSEIDSKSTGQACFIDLQKAFDTLDHKILLEKLEKYGYRGPIYKLLNSYLNDRWQYIDLNGTCTSKKQILTGVPQGSILGPFLFLLYINDLDENSGDSNVTMFADDTTLINAGKSKNFSVQEDIDKITSWLIENKLTINVDKCEVMFFGSGNPQLLKIDENNQQFKSCCKYLGLYVDKWLRFNQHIDYIVKKLNKFCGLIYCTRHLYPRKCLILFYNSFAKSIINYGILVYGSAAKTNLAKIEIVQRRIMRAIFFKKKFESMKEIMIENGIQTVFELYVAELIKELFRQLRFEAPNQYLQETSTVGGHLNTRGKEKGLLRSNYCRTVVKKKSIGNSLRKAYNWLTDLKLIPVELQTMTKWQVKQYLHKLNAVYVMDNRHLFSMFF